MPEDGNMSSPVVFAAVALTLVATPALPQVKASNAPSVPIAPVITPRPPLAAELPVYILILILQGGVQERMRAGFLPSRPSVRA
jgi:hypothetical protein